MSKDKSISRDEQKRVTIAEFSVGVQCKMKVTVNEKGEIIMGQMEDVSVGGFKDSSTPFSEKFIEDHSPELVAWLAKLIFAGAEEAHTEYMKAKAAGLHSAPEAVRAALTDVSKLLKGEES